MSPDLDLGGCTLPDIALKGAAGVFIQGPCQSSALDVCGSEASSVQGLAGLRARKAQIRPKSSALKLALPRTDYYQLPGRLC